MRGYRERSAAHRPRAATGTTTPPVMAGPDLVQRVFERRRDAEVAAAAANRPDEIGVLGGACAHHSAVRRHHVGSQQVVERHLQIA
jgi:hypothetical protein